MEIPLNKNEHSTIKFDWSEGFVQDDSSHQTIRSKRFTKSYTRKFLNSKNPSFSKKNGKRITYIDLFCGGGGLSLGVHHALHTFGYDARLLLAADKDQSALKLIKHHFKPMVQSSTPIEDWLRYSVDLSGEEKTFPSLPEIRDPQINQFKGKVDLLVGGPPCQGHSNLNNKTRRSDPRNLLYFSMPALAIGLDIPTVIIENVRSIKHASENVVDITTELFRAHGYFVKEVTIDGVNCGVAQTRKRHFLLANRFQEPETELAMEQLQTETLSFDDVNNNLGELKTYSALLEGRPKLSSDNEDRIAYLHNSEDFNLKRELRPVCHRDGHTYPSVYGRLDGNKPAGTITTGFLSPGRGRFIHPHEPRMITTREAARLQCFPDWYFAPAETLGMKQQNLVKIIGDAVPALMVFPVIASVIKSLKK